MGKDTIANMITCIRNANSGKQKRIYIYIDYDLLLKIILIQVELVVYEKISFSYI